MKTIIISLKVFLFFTVLTGIVYPLLVTGIAQIAFPAKANGSIITHNNVAVGSELIGQTFDDEQYFSGRPSAIHYNPLPSGGSNLGLTNPKLKQLVDDRKREFLRFNQLDTATQVPAEMLFASASGLDPHISPQAAMLQVERIAKARNFNEMQRKKLVQLVDSNVEPAQMRVFGQERVTVLLLNLGVEKMEK